MPNVVELSIKLYLLPLACRAVALAKTGWGRLGGGEKERQCKFALYFYLLSPPPLTPPTKGRGFFI